MNFSTFMDKWFWVVFIAATYLNAGIFRLRAQSRIKMHPELAKGYDTLIRGFVTWAIIPWLVMGAGCVFGGVSSIDDFFRPRDGNPFVLAFLASIFFIWIAGTFWLFFRGGAEMIVKHPGLFSPPDFKSPFMVKAFWLICLAGGIFAVIMMFMEDFRPE